jgi:hypothetical protein
LDVEYQIRIGKIDAAHYLGKGPNRLLGGRRLRRLRGRRLCRNNYGQQQQCQSYTENPHLWTSVLKPSQGPPHEPHLAACLIALIEMAALGGRRRACAHLVRIRKKGELSPLIGKVRVEDPELQSARISPKTRNTNALTEAKVSEATGPWGVCSTDCRRW